MGVVPALLVLSVLFVLCELLTMLYANKTKANSAIHGSIFERKKYAKNAIIITNIKPVFISVVPYTVL